MALIQAYRFRYYTLVSILRRLKSITVCFGVYIDNKFHAPIKDNSMNYELLLQYYLTTHETFTTPHLSSFLMRIYVICEFASCEHLLFINRISRSAKLSHVNAHTRITNKQFLEIRPNHSAREHFLYPRFKVNPIY